MAEKFTLPKRFTKEWFGYIWDYYKYHILIGIAVVLIAIMTICEITGREKYDESINFVSKYIIDIETAEKLETYSQKGSRDLDGNGEINIFFSQINFTEEAKKDPNTEIALRNKLMSLFVTEDEFLYIFDKKIMEGVLASESTEGLFVPADKWSDIECEDGTFGVSLKDSDVFEKAGVKSEDLYILIRECYNKDNEKLMEKQENAINLAKFLVK